MIPKGYKELTGSLFGILMFSLPNHCSETSKRRKEFNNFPSNSCQCFCVMHAPEIYQPSGLVVVSELLTAIQASDVGPSAIDRSASVKVGSD